jgi:hypothetical protein
LVAACGQLPLGAAKSTAKPGEERHPAKTASEDEEKALDKTFQSAERNPQTLINNLEDFLACFPKTSRRELVLQGRVVYRQEGLDPVTFVEELAKHLHEALQQPAAAAGLSR